MRLTCFLIIACILVKGSVIMDSWNFPKLFGGGQRERVTSNISKINPIVGERSSARQSG